MRDDPGPDRDPSGDVFFGTTRHPCWIAWGIGSLLTASAVALILLRTDPGPTWDQSFIAYRLSEGYPHFESGIVSYLLVGVLREIAPVDLVMFDKLVRAVAALLYLGSAGLLAWAVTGPARLWGFIAFLVLLVTARFPFLWLSSELFAGGFLMLFLWSFVRGRSIALTGLFLALFGLAKADLAVPALLVGGYLVLGSEGRLRWRWALVLGGYALVLVVPSLFTPSYYAQFGGRAWVSFGQHYGELVRPHQLEPAPDGWSGWPTYLERAFPGSTSVPEAAYHHPRTYLGFVALSTAESGVRLLLGNLLFLIPLAAFFFPRMRAPWRVVTLLLLTGILPVLLVSFLHVRYQARFYPLALFVVFAGMSARELTRRHERAVAVLLAALALWQAYGLAPVLESAYWLPD